MTNELYIKCPRCRGNRFVYAITRPGNDYRPSISEEFACPLCSMTGEVHRDDAARYEAEQRETEDQSS